MKKLLSLLIVFTSFGIMPSARADQVIMKDGTVYKGKILIHAEKAILIGNPPFDPNSYLLENKDIDKIIFDEYHPNPPAERRRGFTSALHMTGQTFSSDELSLGTAAGLSGEIGFRVHPLVEIDGGMSWIPSLNSDDGILLSDGTVARQYKHFWLYGSVVSGRLYPFFNQKKWKLEPYVLAGYQWNRLIPKASGDRFQGNGWRFGAGALYPLSSHWFLDARLLFDDLSFDTVQFQGREGSVQPTVSQHLYALSTGISYRL
ncbi:MAG: outer membrane beta-barrel protein [Elusimicrobiota bacterium]